MAATVIIRRMATNVNVRMAIEDMTAQVRACFNTDLKDSLNIPTVFIEHSSCFVSYI